MIILQVFRQCNVTKEGDWSKEYSIADFSRSLRDHFPQFSGRPSGGKRGQTGRGDMISSYWHRKQDRRDRWGLL